MTTKSQRRSDPTESRGLVRPDILPAGIADIRGLPDDDFDGLWGSIVVDPEIKDQLLAQAILNFTLRGQVPRAKLPLHGILLLVGLPGTGKTSLARGLASRTAEALKSPSQFRYVEVDPHSLTSSALGKTQRAVTELFHETIAEQVELGPTIVILDEVETLLVDRTKLSLEANPIDVHRATDAALVQLDHLAESTRNLLFVATSNFERAIDQAFVSRADLVLTVPLPDHSARLRILKDTLEAMTGCFKELRRLSNARELDEVAVATEGLDGRALRKIVAAACARDKRTALNPGLLTADALLAAAKAAVRERDKAGRIVP